MSGIDVGSALVVCLPESRRALQAYCLEAGLAIAAWMGPCDGDNWTTAFRRRLSDPEIAVVAIDTFRSIGSTEARIFECWRAVKAVGKAFHRIHNGGVASKDVAVAALLDLHGIEAHGIQDPIAAGLRPIVNIPFGLAKTPDRMLAVVETERALIIEVCRKVVAGASLRDAARILDGAAPAPRGGAWEKNATGNLLRNSSLLGLRKWSWPPTGARGREGRVKFGSGPFLTYEPAAQITDGDLWLSVGWSIADRTFDTGPQSSASDDLLAKRGRCGCGGLLTPTDSNGRRSLVCANSRDTRRSCDEHASTPLEWIEAAALDAVRRTIDLRRAKLPVPRLAAFDARTAPLAKALAAGRFTLPFDPAAMPGMAEDLRSAIKGFVRSRGEDEHPRLDFEIDVGALFKPDTGLSSMMPARVVLDLDTDAIKAAERVARDGQRDAAMVAAASDGTHDIGDEAWRMIQDVFAPFDRVNDAIPARLLLDGLLCVVATKGTWSRVPARFGDPKAFHNAWCRLVRTGAWDRAVAILERHFPGLIGEDHLRCLTGASFPRAEDNGPRVPRAFSKVEIDRYRPALEALAASHGDNAGVQTTFAILIDTFDGIDRKETARRQGVPIGLVYDTVSALRRGRSTDVFKPTERRRSDRPNRLKISADDVEALKTFVLMPGRQLTLAAIIEWIDAKTGIRYHPQGMRRLLQRERITIPRVRGAER